MAKQIVMTMVTTPHLSPMPETSLIVDIGAEVLADEIAVYIGDNVNEARTVEIINAWKWLYDGLQDRALLDNDWQGVTTYTGSNIDELTEADRRTESVLATLTEDDIIIGIGGNITARGGLNIIHTAIRMLCDFARENVWQDASVPATETPTLTILKATGVVGDPAVLQISGATAWAANTQIDVQATTTAGAFGYTGGTGAKKSAGEVAANMSDFFKGWSQSTLTHNVDPYDPTVALVFLYPFAGGTDVSFVSAAVL